MPVIWWLMWVTRPTHIYGSLTWIKQRLNKRRRRRRMWLMEIRECLYLCIRAWEDRQCVWCPPLLSLLFDCVCVILFLGGSLQMRNTSEQNEGIKPRAETEKDEPRGWKWGESDSWSQEYYCWQQSRWLRQDRWDDPDKAELCREDWTRLTVLVVSCWCCSAEKWEHSAR